jgi:hypothetical protein
VTSDTNPQTTLIRTEGGASGSITMRSLASSWRFLLPACLGSAAVVGPLRAQASGSGEYHVARQVTLGGNGRWDYIVLDTAANRLFIARQDRVMVVDPDAGKLRGRFAGSTAPTVWHSTTPLIMALPPRATTAP